MNRRLMRMTGIWVIAVVITAGVFPWDEVCAGTGGSSSAASQWQFTRKLNPLRMVVVFVKFKDEAPGDSLAPAWANQLFTGQPGSIPHFFKEVSFDKFDISGFYLPKRYEAPRDSSEYVGNRNLFARDILNLLDADPTVDFTQFDNDGVDGVPGSADDDRYVDYIVLMPMSRPYNFIQGLATGVATLGLSDTFYSSDKNVQGFFIKLDRYAGCVATAPTLQMATSTIIGELGHAFGAVDLMDRVWNTPASDSAGAGYWDFVAQGALGWEGRNGPMGPNAYNRMLMECVGLDNANIVTVYGYHQNVRVTPIGQEDGTAYRLWIGDNNQSRKEYFLIENRRADGFYYDRFIPEDGLLIWHVLEAEGNGNELMKECDLECPDGRYLDAGYPMGRQPDPINGGDNLDFWAHDNNYTIMHNGNSGDAYDVYDGVRYTRFTSDTNPNTFSKLTKRTSGIEIYNIRRDGRDMVFDCIVPPFYNWYDETFPYIGSAIHRFATTTIDAAKPATPEAYVIRMEGSGKADAVVIVDGSQAVVETTILLDPSEVDLLVDKRLMPTLKDMRSVRIVRQNVPVTELNGIMAAYGIAPSELGGGVIASVQKVIRVDDSLPREFTIRILPNFPNPFNASTTISYIMPSPGLAVLEVYNVLGQRVMTIDQGIRGIGRQTVVLDAGVLGSGIYLYRITGAGASPAGTFTVIR